MNAVGSLLKSARERQSKTIDQVAEELCITPRYLRAIESDDLPTLPGAFFYRSFVRQYANLLGVEWKTIQQGVDALIAPPEESVFVAPTETYRAPVIPAAPVRRLDPIVQDQNRVISDRRIGFSMAALAVVLVACSAFYAWWTSGPDTTTAVAAAAPAPAQTSPAQVSPTQAPKTDSTLTPVSSTSSSDLSQLQRADLEISATEQVWVSITSHGEVIFSGILEPTQTKSLTGVDGAQMKIGNAGGVDVRWKGKPIGPVGPKGQVRTVLLKTDDVEILQPQLEFSEL